MKVVINKIQTDVINQYTNEDIKELIHFAPNLFDGEFTSCGFAFVDTDYKTSNKKIDCEMCLRVINYYKKLRIVAETRI